MTTVTVFHRTSAENADAIERDGFRDDRRTGRIWVALNDQHGHGPTLFYAEVPADTLETFRRDRNEYAMTAADANGFEWKRWNGIRCSPMAPYRCSQCKRRDRDDIRIREARARHANRDR